MECRGCKSTPPPGKAESSVQRGGPRGPTPVCPGPRRVATGSGSLRRKSQGVSLLERPGARVPAPLSLLRPAAHCSPHLEARGAPTAGGVPIAAPSPPGRIRWRSSLQSGSDAAAPAAGAARQARGAARDTATPGAPFAARGSAVLSIHQGPRSRAQRRLPPGHRCTPGPGQLRQGAGSSESALPGGFGSDGHFLTPAASRERGSASPPLTTSGPPRDGEIAGM
ncbi:hypothetical protein NDU88_004612, partial [Pleurodeles waltl]